MNQQLKRTTEPNFWLGKKADEWDRYTQPDTLYAPHRDAIIAALQQLPPFTSLLELGCGPGPLLWRILDAFPDADLTGIDISPIAVEKGEAWFRRMGNDPQFARAFRGRGRVALCQGALPQALLPTCEPPLDPVDVIVSCYSMAYVTPEAWVKGLMPRLVDLARQAIVIFEPMVVVGDPPGLAQLVRVMVRDRAGHMVQGEFKYDYLGWFKACAPNWEITHLQPLSVNRANRLLVAQRRTS